MADFDARPLLVSETASVWDVACPGAYDGPQPTD